ncbi:pilus assembly protein PilP [Salinicola aestuarinus]|uniref:pilus assembly protein PilP n=1 Tax=Salinicola aestuarinus TaxID=1949082 RepID=UPI000DA22A43|nr:pilus assembly protein PilP [Salinicola aestuarinus]
MSRSRPLALATLLGLTLGGCADADLGALESHLDALRHAPQGQIAELPEMPSFEAVDYRQRERRSPFVADVAASRESATEAAPLPDAARASQPLEAFDLESLELVGTLSVGGRDSGLIRSPEGRVHRLFVGDYLGRDDGQVVAVGERKLSLVETVRDAQGHWMERPRQLLMTPRDTDGDAGGGRERSSR